MRNSSPKDGTLQWVWLLQRRQEDKLKAPLWRNDGPEPIAAHARLGAGPVGQTPGEGGESHPGTHSSGLAAGQLEGKWPPLGVCRC